MKNLCIRCEAKVTLRDVMQNPWCEEHRLRHDLMNWGNAHEWPLVNAQAREETVDIRRGRNRYYAIGPGHDLWHTACILGTDHFLQALGETVLASGKEEHE